MFILNGENNNQRRRIPVHLVSSSDGITALTGQTGTGKVAINYGAPKTTVNSLVEIDSSNMPGDYYLELTPLEVKDLGMGLLRIKTGSSAEYVYAFQVIAYDPFNKLYGEGGTPLTMAGGDISYSKVRTIVAEEIAKIPKPTEAKEVDFKPISQALQAILSEVREIDIPEAKEVDFKPIMAKIEAVEGVIRTAIGGIKFPEIPKPQPFPEIPKTDLTPISEPLGNLAEALKERNEIDGSLKEIVEKLDDALDMHKMRSAFESINKPKEPQENKPRFEKPKLV
jgi:hypothetical protein